MKNEIYRIPQKRVAEEVEDLCGHRVSCGGSTGKWLAVVAAVAIPAAAPALTAKLAGSQVLGAATSGFLKAGVGKYIGSAVISAGLSAVNAKVHGMDASDAAEAGALSGLFAQGTADAASWFKARQAASAGSGTAAGATTGPSSYGGPPSVSSTSSPAHVAALEPFGGAGATIPGATTTTTATGGGANTASLWERSKALAAEVGATPGEIMATYTDRAKLAELTLSAASKYTGYYLSSQPTKAEEAIMKQQERELEQIRQRSEAEFNERLKGARELLNQAKQQDPNYHANLAANKARIEAGQVVNAARRSAGSSERISHARRGFSAGDERRAGLDVSRLAAGSFDRGFTEAQSRQNALTQTGLASLPSPSTKYSEGLQKLKDQYTGLHERGLRGATAFSDWLGYGTETPEEESGA